MKEVIKLKNIEVEFETLHSNKHRIRFFVSFVCVVVLLVLFIVGRSHAKYRVTQSIPLVNGTINYTPYDFKMIAMYQKDDSGEYVEIDVMPSSGYVINETESYCTIDNVNKDEEAILYTDDEGQHVIGNLKKNSKCYLYFDEYIPTFGDTLLANYPTQLTRTDFSTTVTSTTTGTIYYADTSKGRTYYFAGNPTDNWVSFGGFYWRIIRINEDGTIRIIYQGTSANTTGEGTQIGTSAFNSSWNNNMYIGYMYTSGNVHGLGTNSGIKSILDTWYQNNLATNYGDKIDGNAGFCGDRQPSTSSSTSNGSGGTGTTTTYYGGYIRLITNNEPTFECENDSDLYTTSGSNQGNNALTYPIGLISADEVAYAGVVAGTSNQNYYLYTNQYYWTMSPFSFSTSAGNAGVFAVYSNGIPNFQGTNVTNGVRPVINLKADVQISTGSGTSSDPYVIA